jgi:hypothetical protein
LSFSGALNGLVAHRFFATAGQNSHNNSISDDAISALFKRLGDRHVTSSTEDRYSERTPTGGYPRNAWSCPSSPDRKAFTCTGGRDENFVTTANADSSFPTITSVPPVGERNALCCPLNSCTFHDGENHLVRSSGWGIDLQK